MPSAMVDVILDCGCKEIVRHNGIAAGKRDRTAGGKCDQPLPFGHQQMMFIALDRKYGYRLFRISPEYTIDVGFRGLEPVS